MNLKDLTITKFREGLLSKKFSALEVAQEYFNHIKKTDEKIGAYLSLNEELALKQAEQVDLAVARDENVGWLAGVPMAIKDVILVKGQPATAASKILENYTASYDAGVIQKLKAEKAVFLGKTNLDEFAMGSSTENSGFKVTRNPCDHDCVPGGSSGGSAAAVAADLCVAALGSDTGGSIRQPAAFCGVVGLKPTYGAVSRSGLIAMASSLDQIGPITKTVEDAALLFKTIAGRDPMDAASVDYNYDVTSSDFGKIINLTIGLPSEYFIEGLSDEVRIGVESAVEKLKKLKLKFKKISLPRTKYALSTYYIIMPAEVSSNLARFDGIRYARLRDANLRIHANDANKISLKDIYLNQRGGGFGPETKRRIILGTFVLSSGYYDAYYQKAQRVRTLIKNDFDEAFREVDVILTPVTPTAAFKIGEKTGDPLQMYLSDIFTIPANLAGVPALSIPVEEEREKREEKSLPVGFQLIGKHFREADIIGLGMLYEKVGRSV